MEVPRCGDVGNWFEKERQQAKILLSYEYNILPKSPQSDGLSGKDNLRQAIEWNAVSCPILI
ncbi:hypothetical protein ACFLUO_04765 [Chloroflexota bacterium]